MRGIHELVDGHQARNFFLDMIVGLAAAARRVDAIAARAAAAPRVPGAPSEPHVFDDFALGVISFSRTVLRHLEHARVEPGSLEPGVSEEAARVRDLLL